MPKTKILDVKVENRGRWQERVNLAKSRKTQMQEVKRPFCAI